MTKFYFKSIFFIAAFAVFYLALAPSDNVWLDFGLGDKFNHFLAFFTLSLLLNRSSSSYEKRLRNVTALFLFGVLIEIVQAFIAYRSSSVEDLFADLLGIFTFQAFYSIYRWIRYRV
jgi:VanZ family protein